MMCLLGTDKRENGIKVYDDREKTVHWERSTGEQIKMTFIVN